MNETLTTTAARARLYEIVEEVNTDHTVKRITSKKGDVVIMSAADWDSWQETMYLMRSPANHQRLADAMEDVRQGRDLITLTEKQWAALGGAVE